MGKVEAHFLAFFPGTPGDSFYFILRSSELMFIL